MFGIGGFELFIILLFGFLLFGPDKLPSMARTIGRGIAKFRAAQQEMSDVIKESNAFNPNDEPFKDPTETIDKLASTAEKHLRSATSGVKSSIQEKTHDEQAVKAADETSAAGKRTAKTLLDVTGEKEHSAEQAVAPSSIPTNETAAEADAPASAADAVTAAPAVKTESFTERKARYERERAARLAASQQADADATAEGGER